MLFLIILLFTFMGLIDILSLYYKKRYKEIYLYSVLLAGAFILCFIAYIGIRLPSPAWPIRNVILTIIAK